MLLMQEFSICRIERKKAFTGFILLLIIAMQPAMGQHLELLTGGNKSSLRGLCALNDKVIWVCGSMGKVGRSTDGGVHWDWMQPAGFETRDFRDIEAFDANTAVILAVGEPAVILRTTDAGQHWEAVYTDPSKGVFMDAMDFADDQHGIVAGDPLPGSGGRLYLLTTSDQGKHWTRMDTDKAGLPLLKDGEAMFASSGTNIKYHKAGKNTAAGNFSIITGGTAASLIQSQPPAKHPLPLQQGLETTGANSIDFKNSRYLIVVGGNFAKDRDASKNCFISTDGGQHWKAPQQGPAGFRSSVCHLSAGNWLTCGTSGVDVSKDGGMNWRLISVESFHVCRKAKHGSSVFLAGADGRVALFAW